jgi:hypothetical protein
VHSSCAKATFSHEDLLSARFSCLVRCCRPEPKFVADLHPQFVQQVGVSCARMSGRLACMISCVCMYTACRH